MKAKFSRRGAVALIIGGDLLLLLLGWTLLVSPQRQTAADIARATQVAEAQIQQAQHVAQQPAIPTVVPKQPEIRTAALYQLAKAMPTTTDIPDVLLELDQVARAAGVTVVSINPGAVTPSNGFGVFAISISFTGDFYSLTDLLYRLRALVTVRHGELDASGRLFAVETFGLSPVGGNSRQLNASVTVDAYVYGAAVSIPAPVTPPPSTDTTGTDTTSTTTTSETPSADAAP
jgi:Tfp pilus assembly protein PilO